ncbi:MAG: 2-iminoacetate synthase ThiH [Desulfovibrionaceae bacterium]|nr:2-iminoacetate synthase ThiH [Desulfovibrionaceae bacterium]
MSFLPEALRLSQTPLQPHFEAVSGDDVRRIIGRERVDASGFLALLSPAAAPHLEAMGRRAHALTLRNFGRTISLFTPLYVSNHCANHCRYCGFAAPNTIPRTQLSLDEVRAEGQAIAATGLKHLLLLTGEAPRKAGVEYLEACVRVLRPLFPSISVEVYPMETADYARLVQAGVDGLTVFQETYDPVLYAQLHPAGPKRDYAFRLNTPQRGAEAGMRVVNIGALLGLTDWRQEIYATGLHAAWLQKRYPGVDVAVSLPRMRPHAGAFQPACVVSDRELVQAMTALRIFLPRLSITISTREAPDFRDNILPLGVTRMSAGVSTAVGGHAKPAETGQFEISDPRSVDEMKESLRKRGYQAVFKDWEPLEGSA